MIQPALDHCGERAERQTIAASERWREGAIFGSDAEIAGAEHIGSELDGLRQRLAFSPDSTTAAQVLAAVGAQAEIRDLTVEEPAIEDIVATLYAVRR